MEWKTTKTIPRDKLEKEIELIINHNIEKLSDDTLCCILGMLGDDENTEIYSGYNYMVGNTDYED